MPKELAACLKILQDARVERIGWIPQESHPLDARHDLREDFQRFPAELRKVGGGPGNVAAGSTETGD